MLTTQVPDSNQVGQIFSRPAGDVSPPKPSIELKPLPDHLKYAYLGDEQQFLVVPKKFWMTVMKNRNDKLVPTRVQNSWRVCIDYRKLNDKSSENEKPKIVRGDRLDYQHTMVDPILSVLANGGEPSSFFHGNIHHFDNRGASTLKGMNRIAAAANQSFDRNIDGCGMCGSVGHPTNLFHFTRTTTSIQTVAEGHEKHTVPTKGEFFRKLDQPDAHKQHGIPRRYVHHTTGVARFAKTNFKINRHYKSAAF
ncbi:hypothetical protein CR513_07168, partial [Mucuna pruriens]